MTRVSAAAAVAVAAALASGAPRDEYPVPFSVGETLTYDVSWSTFPIAGTAEMSVREKKPSYKSVAYYIVAQGRSTSLIARLYPLYYKLDTLLDSYSLVSQRASTYSEEGGRHRYREVIFDRPAQDPLSSLYVLRTMELKTGARKSMTVTDEGVDYRVDVTVGDLERVKTALGEMRAWKIRVSIASPGATTIRNAAIWMSQDNRHLPVKLQGQLPVGTFDVVLREAH